MFIIRHGETTSNAENRFSGHQDVELTDKGVWQAEQLASRLKSESIDIAYSSNLKRAIHTAEIALQHHDISLNIEPLFKELSFGHWEGLRFEDLSVQSEERSMEWWNYPDVPIPGGESTSLLQKRVKRGLEQLIEKHDEEDRKKTIAIFCHGGVSRIIIGVALNIPLDKIWHIKQSSTAINIIRYFRKTGFYVESLNDINHLKNSIQKEQIIEKP